ncbi:type II toxin-antitoxin system RelE/ParE family toxin [Paraburkholderia sp. MMS20-SJTN17]|uniref:Type II toxin-antitoxin system RelE/ParE family toxin n=1 Tax=Paraburkholderia translucens TaxID=2886945 RepID=A0ABS8KER2_9BURK|nr:type II toxin-antitoxin system RelE/ParE family toxin [Paraburkholderia sp. MMS20-SJTN17]MCC8403252.1 type II toxin-antitoxin system RelE/ParE family toxin [Paraburkholderia sp. MMS20-SJTN17]
MAPTKFKLLILDEAQEDTKHLRRYILRSFGAETWKQTSTQLAATFGNVRQFPQSGCIPAELADFGGLNFREALSGQNRVIYEVRGDTIYIHVVTDTRRDLRTLLQKRLLRARL